MFRLWPRTNACRRMKQCHAYAGSHEPANLSPTSTTPTDTSARDPLTYHFQVCRPAQFKTIREIGGTGCAGGIISLNSGAGWGRNHLGAPDPRWRIQQAAQHRCRPSNQGLSSMCPSVPDLKPGRALAFEHCAVQFAGRTLIWAKYAVATPHSTAAFSALHFARRDVLAPTAASVLDFCRAFGFLLLSAARP